MGEYFISEQPNFSHSWPCSRNSRFESLSKLAWNARLTLKSDYRSGNAKRLLVLIIKPKQCHQHSNKMTMDGYEEVF